MATGAVKRAKLQSDVTTDIRAPNFLQTGCPSCHPTNGVGELKEEHKWKHVVTQLAAEISKVKVKGPIGILNRRRIVDHREGRITWRSSPPQFFLS